MSLADFAAHVASFHADSDIGFSCEYSCECNQSVRLPLSISQVGKIVDFAAHIASSHFDCDIGLSHVQSISQASAAIRSVQSFSQASASFNQVYKETLRPTWPASMPMATLASVANTIRSSGQSNQSVRLGLQSGQFSQSVRLVLQLIRSIRRPCGQPPC
jgi:hypothetical protein